MRRQLIPKKKPLRCGLLEVQLQLPVKEMHRITNLLNGADTSSYSISILVSVLVAATKHPYPNNNKEQYNM